MIMVMILVVDDDDDDDDILGPKKGTHFFTLTMFWPRPEKVVQRKKVPLPK